MSKIIGKRPPTEKTPGILGQEYIDSTTGKTYVCTYVNYGAVNDEPAGEIEGRYTWVEGSGGGASSWNDLKDRPFDEETSEIVIFPEEELIYDDSYRAFIIFTPFTLVVGEEYIVNWDGKEYIFTAEQFGPSIMLGSTGVLNGDVTIPFAILCGGFGDEIFAEVSTLPGVTHAVMSIKQRKNVVRTLDPKYIKDMYYETKKTEYILENFNLGGTYHHGMGNMVCPLDPVVNFDNLEDGQKCYLDFNGTIYEGIFISSGNPRMNFENVEFNGKTFPISVSADDVTMSNAYMPDNSVWSTANISVYVEVVDVHGIDPKYLGDVNAHFEAIHSEINGRFTPVYEILNSLNTTYCTKDELAELCTKDELAELCTKDELAEIMGSYINDIDTLVGGDS